VAAEDGNPGALVSPIVTAEGCVGVLAAEISGGRESREDVRALATIFAAQLATVVSPVVAADQQAQAAR
jgi:GAF domain-containing protein